MTFNPATENERRTRRARIDPRLRSSGWQVVSFDHRKPLNAYGHAAIEEYPTANGPADYALVVEGQLLGVVEAKKVTLIQAGLDRDVPDHALRQPRSSIPTWAADSAGIAYFEREAWN